MELNIVWSNFAWHEYNEALTHIYKEFGLKAAEKLRTDVDKCLKQIARNPEIAAPEEFLVNEKILYRSKIVSKHNKVVYTYDTVTIRVSDFWDMRREPTSLSRRVKKK